MRPDVGRQRGSIFTGCRTDISSQIQNIKRHHDERTEKLEIVNRKNKKESQHLNIKEWNLSLKGLKRVGVEKLIVALIRKARELSVGWGSEKVVDNIIMKHVEVTREAKGR